MVNQEKKYNQHNQQKSMGLYDSHFMRGFVDGKKELNILIWSLLTRYSQAANILSSGKLDNGFKESFLEENVGVHHKSQRDLETDED